MSFQIWKSYEPRADVAAIGGGIWTFKEWDEVNRPDGYRIIHVIVMIMVNMRVLWQSHSNRLYKISEVQNLLI